MEIGSQWPRLLQYTPVIAFILSMQLYEFSIALMGAGLVALGAIAFSIQQRILMDRLFLGVNLYLLLGGIGFTFGIAQLIKWYSTSTSGPFFSCIVVIGLLTTLCTKTGFLGKKGISKDAARYGSFVLLAATFIALIWSIQQDEQGIFWAVILPFGVLLCIQYQMRQHIR